MPDAPDSTNQVTSPPSSSDFLPDPVRLERYENLVPGISRRIFSQWELEVQHRREIERRGLNYAFAIALAFLILSFLIILVSIIARYTPGTVGGTVLGTVDIVALVSIFIYGRSRQG